MSVSCSEGKEHMSDSLSVLADAVVGRMAVAALDVLQDI
jgi:hypothetical protein